MQQQITLIKIELLDPHEHNPRGAVDPESVRELADSIRQQGILEPLIVVPGVRKKGQDWKIERYTVVCGHRRLAAAQLAGLEEVPAIVREIENDQQLEIALIENIQRKSLTALEQAKAFKSMIDSGMTQADVARKIGRSSAVISHHMQVLKLSAPLQKLYELNKLPLTAAPELQEVKNADRQLNLAQKLADRQITVPQLKKIVKRMNEPPQTAGQAGARASNREPKPSPVSEPAVISQSREAAVKRLSSMNGSTLDQFAVHRAFKRTCTACGLENTESCDKCVLPQMIHHLVGLAK